jgi:predicted ATPase
MATVYLAEDIKHHRHVAIKVLKPAIATAIGRDRFLREIEIAAQLHHPHVVPLFDSGAAGDLLYYVMPFVLGESLRARLDRERQMPVDEAVRLTREIASALGHAHQQGLVHRDVKPENVLLADDIALVADFGIARAVSGADVAETRLTTVVGGVLGTPSYMSPEQASGAEVDGRSDLYALACVLFEMLAGQPPLVAPTVDGVLRMHLTVEPRPVTELRPSVPSAVAAVISRALAKVPADRYVSMARFAEALTAAARETQSLTLTPAPPHAERTPPHNLPKQRTHFIGRQQELAQCARLMGDTRLLTITGIGGGGKTRLAIELARTLLPSFPDGVCFVDLAPLTNPERLIEVAGAALGVREEVGTDFKERVAARVAGLRLLLVIDNCEHLLAASAELADTILTAGEDVRILATSREGLGVEGERIFALHPLGVPAETVSHDLQQVATSEGVRLFVDRAQAVDREFALDASNAATVAEICRRLDGIPLAIELAAARVKVLSLDQIRTRLDDRFRLLTGGVRTGVPRHQTLRATIQWSYEQLSSAEQKLLRALAAFAGGCTLEEATHVALETGDEFQVMDLLGHLVDKSLVVVDRVPDADPRYRLLETVRQYGQEQLVEAGEADTVRRRHLAEYLALAERAYSERFAREEAWSAVLEREHGNLRAALDLARQADAEQYLRLAGALAWFWQVRSHLLEGREHLRQALAASDPNPPRAARARALWGAAQLQAWQGESAAARPMMEEALQMWRDIGDPREVALALEGVGWMQFLGGEDEAACTTFEECLRMRRGENDAVAVNRAMVALGQALVALSRVDEARTLAAQIIAFSGAHGDRRSEHFGWHYIADCALIEGNCTESLALYGKSLRLAQALGDRLEISFEVQGVAMSLACLGHPERGLRLAAAAREEWTRIGVHLHIRFWDALIDRNLEPARQALGEDVATRVWAEGRALPFDQAVAQALDYSGEGHETHY